MDSSIIHQEREYFMKQRTILFFDDEWLTERHNVIRKTGHPVLKQEAVYVDPEESKVNLAWGYPLVHKTENRWLLFYQGWPAEGSTLPAPIPLLAESMDGFHWKPVDLRRVPLGEERFLMNQILPFHLDGATILESQFFFDERAIPEERFKALTLYKSSELRFLSPIFVSPDGIHWKRKENAYWHEGTDAPDYPICIYWNAVRESYTLSARPMHCDRRISVCETKDWQHFSKPELVFQPDAMDPPLSDFYGMPVLTYKDYFIGLLEIYCAPPYLSYQGISAGAIPTHKFLGGHVAVQLAYSTNGWHYQRSLRENFIIQGKPGSTDFGCVYPCCAVNNQNELIIYASVSKREHGYTPKSCGAIAAYSLRPDGFVSLCSENGYGTITTKGLYLEEGNITFNLCCPNGRFRVEVLTPEGNPIPGYSMEECVPFQGDSLCMEPVWNSGRVLQELSGQVIVLKMELQEAELFSYTGKLLPLTPYQTVDFLKFHTIPKERVGF